ncbi:MAG: hypothetical protein EOO78_27750, partial [Oxalobacteraceae bacterium]
MPVSADELEEFATESRELIADAEKALLDLEGGATFASAFDAVFRAFHSIKGMSGMLGAVELQQHVHQLESLLVTFKTASTLPKEYVDLFLRGCDATMHLLAGESVTFSYEPVGSQAAAPTAPPAKAPSAAAADALPAVAADAEPAPAEAVGSMSAADADQGKPAAALDSEASSAAEAWAKVEELSRQLSGEMPEQSAKGFDGDARDFVTEADETANRLSQVLAVVEAGGVLEPAAVDSLYRDVHTIKGGAQLFAMPRLAETAHALESILEPIRRRGVSLSAAEVE